MKHLALSLFLLFSLSGFYAQGQAPTQTAKDYIRPYNEPFQYGVNLGYYNAAWSDEQLAAAGQTVGVHSLRPTLPESFLEQYGYSVRANTFSAYVNSYGMKELTCFLEGPSAAHRDPTTYPGATRQSKLFDHLYEPIWNSDGTVNQNNYYAYYLYKVLLTYGDKVRFWEIVNEPDYTYGSNQNDWLTRAPAPDEVPNLQAPVFHYIRMLRISYEVIKKYRPETYITTGGVGYPQFVDALLRYTDNPNGGAVTAAYPHTAGAYLDALSFHSYPSYSLHYWDNAISGFRYTRTSDYAANQMLKDRQGMADVLAKYGYGTTYPAKSLLLSETNISRRTSDDRTGSDEMQRNYGIKTLVLAQKNNIKQLYFYGIGEGVNAPPAGTSVSGSDELALMGLFENLNRDAPGAQKPTQQGQAFATTSKLLYGWNYDAARTAALALPSSIDGAAFSKNGTYAYVLWAKALTDNSEVANATYSFPSAWNLSGLQRYEWTYATTNASTTLTPQSIALTGAPLFLLETTAAPAGVVLSSINPTSAAVGQSVTLTGTNLTGATKVSFNGTATSVFASNSATQLVLNVPSGATTGPVTVTTSAGTSNSLAFTVTIPAATSYTLTTAVVGSGTVSTSPSAASYADGTAVSLTATPASGYQFSGWSGDATGTTNPLSVTMTANKTITATFTAVAAAAPQVTSFTLVNADTQQDIRELVAGDVLNLATLPTQNLNIRANTSPATVGSVKFSLTGTAARSTNDSNVPYSLFGDANGRYKAWTPAVGSYSLTATAYTAAGAAGPALARNFTVVKQVMAVATTAASSVATTEPAAQLELAQPMSVFPNPASTEATIEFALNTAQHYTLQLFDVNGRKVAQIASGVADANKRYSFQLNRDLPDGLYVVRLTTDEATQTSRFIKVK